MKIRNMAIFGAIGVAALALIGAGAAATFNATTTSSQTINAGTLSVVVSSPDAPGCTTSADNCTTLTLDSVGPEGSTFDTPASLITITNTGSIPATEISMTISDTPVNSAGLDNGGTLASEMGMCMYSDGAPVVNGDLSAVEGGSAYTLGPSPLATTNSDSYSADFYAGEGSSECGASAAGPIAGPATDTAATTPLTTLAEGGSDTVSIAITYSG